EVRLRLPAPERHGERVPVRLDDAVEVPLAGVHEPGVLLVTVPGQPPRHRHGVAVVAPGRDAGASGDRVPRRALRERAVWLGRCRPFDVRLSHCNYLSPRRASANCSACALSTYIAGSPWTKK